MGTFDWGVIVMDMKCSGELAEDLFSYGRVFCNEALARDWFAVCGEVSFVTRFPDRLGFGLVVRRRGCWRRFFGMGSLGRRVRC